MSLKIIYVRCHMSEVVLCEAPVGTSLFWPAQVPKPWFDGKVHGRWRLCTPVKPDRIGPRTRICPLVHEVPESKLATTIKDAASKLPPIRQRGGTLGVILKGKPYDIIDGIRQRRQYIVQCIGFFHVPPQTDPQWSFDHWDSTTLAPGETRGKLTPDGLPLTLRPRTKRQPVLQQGYGG